MARTRCLYAPQSHGGMTDGCGQRSFDWSNGRIGRGDPFDQSPPRTRTKRLIDTHSVGLWQVQLR